MEDKLLGLVIPSRNNPEKLQRTITALALQNCRELRTVVIGSGDNVSEVIAPFTEEFHLDYIHSDQGGQVYQRTLGVKQLLQEGIRYIGFWDDDLIPDSGCLSEIEAFIKDKNAGGLFDFAFSLNIQNEVSFDEIPFRAVQRLLKRVGSKPGQVTTTGMNTPIANVSSNTETQWVGGGYTIWSASILRKYPQNPMRTTHAAGEDLIYSYPIGKMLPLFVCAHAKVIHNDSSQENPDWIEFRAERTILARLYFCDQHEEINTLHNVFAELIYWTFGLLVPSKNSGRKFVGFLKGVKRYYSGKEKGRAVLDDETFQA
jgi:glycosyltransferase involved in cell wall biosynthesis